MEATKVDFIEELWKEIPGFSATYQVSTLGNVRSKKSTGRWVNMTLQKTETGYLRIIIRKLAGDLSTQRVHRLVAMAFIPNPLSLPEVNHLDRDRMNNCLSNLEWCTPKQNMRHATQSPEYSRMIKKRSLGIRRDKIRRFSLSDIQKIIDMQKQGFLNTAICCEFGISDPENYYGFFRYLKP